MLASGGIPALLTYGLEQLWDLDETPSPGKDGGKVLVPESVFAAHLALGFELLGWRSEREAQSAAGRTEPHQSGNRTSSFSAPSR
jgi:hypothetical protein